MIMSDNKVNRRDFVKTAVGAGLAVSALGPAVRGRILGASDRINIGLIGVGGRGHSLLEWAMKTGQQEATPAHVVAVSDVYARGLKMAKETAKCDGYLDYRELLQRKDVDSVILATPDQCHRQLAVRGSNAAK